MSVNLTSVLAHMTRGSVSTREAPFRLSHTPVEGTWLRSTSAGWASRPAYASSSRSATRASSPSPASTATFPRPAVVASSRPVAQGVGGGDDMVADLDLDRAVVAGGLDEFAD